ncbi:serine hydrolase [Pseudonocardia sp. CNS-139]|nr:serine hydrolase [Pseudonocardia sp. CNS-139]
MADIQRDVQAVLDELVSSGAERGVQAAVHRGGELLVDAVAGVADPATGRPMTPDTPVFVTSTGKGVTATVVHVLAERGVLDYPTRIADLWPEFAAHGKDRATVADALTHAVGVPGLPADITPDAFLDWDAMCALVAGARPWWEPGTATGYHAQTFGWIVGEIVRRASGRRISEVLRDEVAGPLGVAGELFLGVPAAQLPRLARLEDPPPAPAGPGFAMPSPPGAQEGWVWAPPAVLPTAEYGNRADLLTTDVPAGGTMTARAVSRMYAALLHDVDGVRLVGPQRLRAVTAVAVSGPDAVLGNPASWGLGYAVGGPGPFDGPTVFGMAGSGGTAAYADTATGLSVAVTKNRTTFGDFTTYGAVCAAVLKHV